jgi:hypothetical protein
MGRAVPPTAPMPAAGAGGPQGPAGPSQKQQVMTQMAGAAMNMSEIVKSSFQRAVPGWSAELSEPVGPSTGGGELAQQPVSLVAQSGERLAVGRVDSARKTATIRSYDVVSAMCQQRYGRPFNVPPQDYQRFVDTIGRLFGSFGLQVTHETHYTMPSPQGGGPVVAGGGGGSNKTLLVLLLGVIAVLIVVVIVLALR